MDPQTKPSVSTPQADAFRHFIENEVLSIIKDLAEKGETTQERIQALAKRTLELIRPEMKLEELYTNAVKLDDDYSELGPIVIKIMKEYEEKYSKKALDEVSRLIKTGNYQGAQDMVKKVLQFKMAN
ncbi:hypothetical protein HGB07_08385 [Candidatus Roizmanbacteria bacterium]|nr:hypothetical protein [Candidatus Roizmanbacteria bacterium]